MTATTFCIALISAQNRPSNGIDRTCWMTPPVTMLAVPIVSRTKPQKMPACIRPALASLNILVWMNAYSTRLTTRVGSRLNGCDGRRDREDPQVARHRQEEERRRAPEHDEDQRVARDLGERREHRRGQPPSSVVAGVIA